MGHLLMVESWVGAMSTLLPRGIRDTGHRFSFATRDLHHYLRAAPDSGTHPLLGADNVLTVETNDLPGLLDRVERLHATLGFDGVLTSCDYYLPAAAELAARLGLTGPPPDAVERACSKDLTRRTLGAAGVPGPGFALAEELGGLEHEAQRLGYPLVVKPVDLCAGMFVRKVHDAAELREAYRALQEFPVNARGQQRNPVVLLEELLVGEEVSVETVTFRGETTVIGVTDKSVAGEPWFVETGHMFPAALEPDAESEAVSAAVAAIEALGLDDFVGHTEVKLTADGPRIVEVNPRPAGNQITELVRRVTGIDLTTVYAQVALGERPSLDPADTGVRSAAISFLLPPREGRLSEVRGTERLSRADGVADWKVKQPGHRTGSATSNNNYLGHVMVTDEAPHGARAKAESFVGELDVRYCEEMAGAAE